MNEFSRYFPWIVVFGGLVYLVMRMVPARDADDDFHYHEFGKIPVVERGRIKPLDTVARTSLMIISNKQTFTDKDGKRQPAIKWLLDVFILIPDFNNDRAESQKVFRIENLEILDELNLKSRPGSYRYAYEEFKGKIDLIQENAEKAQKKDQKLQTVYDTKILHLAKQLQIFRSLGTLTAPLVVPPPQGDATEEWQGLLKAMGQEKISGKVNPPARSFAKLLFAYADGDKKAFNQELAKYREMIDEILVDDSNTASHEVFFNHFDPFYQCMLLYVVVFVLCCIAWLGWEEPLNRAAFWLCLATFGMHSFALLARMYIQGRPPVTNLYSSAVFIAWGCVGMGLVLEAIFKNGLANTVGSVIGALALEIADHLSQGGDTLEMMQAVLDTNFWLATHVTFVTIGYTATFLAGFLGMVYIFRGVFTPSLDAATHKTLTQMIYGVICFAMFFSFTGTVLGGIWADQSWGRFWGWDPKENGALLIVLWNALILHARWGGLVKQRGVAVLAVVGNMVTAWSWFGTNQLGVGLHAYGFNKTLVTGLNIFWAGNLAFIGAGLLPLRMWQSFSKPRATASVIPVVYPKKQDASISSS